MDHQFVEETRSCELHWKNQRGIHWCIIVKIMLAQNSCTSKSFYYSKYTFITNFASNRNSHKLCVSYTRGADEMHAS